MSGAAQVAHFSRLDLIFAPGPWPFAETHHAAIAGHFAALKAAKPAVWNGRVLLMHHYEIVEDCFRGMFLETDFASLRAWSDWGYPPAGAWNCFGAAAIRGADGGWLLGAMNAHTANSGRVYFPCGTPDPQDVRAGAVDFDASVRRELAEETGLAFDEFDAEPGWQLVRVDALVVMLKVLRARQPAAALRARILGFLGRDPRPELADIRIVRGPADLDAAMPHFVQGFLRHRWQQE